MGIKGINNKIKKVHSDDVPVVSKTVFVGVTGAFGGSGSTSLALTLGRSLIRANKLKVLYISFDYLAEKCAPKDIDRSPVRMALCELFAEEEIPGKIINSYVSVDDFGMQFLADDGFYNPLRFLSDEDLRSFLWYISESALYDMVILDIPFNFNQAQILCSYCEKLIVNEGYKRDGEERSEELKNHLKDAFKEFETQPEVISFSSMEDRASFSSKEADMHGQFAAQVRGFAATIC